mgnify:CR=1 FL=1
MPPEPTGQVFFTDRDLGKQFPARLREAGAIVLGKTVTTEFAYFEPVMRRVGRRKLKKSR